LHLNIKCQEIEELFALFDNSPRPDVYITRVARWHTKLGIFWRPLEYLQPFGTFYGSWMYLHILVFGIFFRFGVLYQEKSGNPVHHRF
jgi:hypothetical protein